MTYPIHRRSRLLDLLQDRPRMLQKYLTFRQQTHAARGPGEERRAKLILQAAELAAQRRLGDVEPSGRSSHVPFLGHGDEVA